MQVKMYYSLNLESLKAMDSHTETLPLHTLKTIFSIFTPGFLSAPRPTTRDVWLYIWELLFVCHTDIHKWLRWDKHKTHSGRQSLEPRQLTDIGGRSERIVSYGTALWLRCQRRQLVCFKRIIPLVVLAIHTHTHTVCVLLAHLCVYSQVRDCATAFVCLCVFAMLFCASSSPLQ